MRRIVFFILAISAILCSCSDYDVKKADTKANRNGFKTCFGFSPDSSVTGIYFFADEWGGDAKYWLAFSAPQTVIEKIIQKWELKPAVADWDTGTGGSGDQFPWWNVEERREADYYCYDNQKKEILRQLWYNPKTKKCQAALTYW